MDYTASTTTGSFGGRVRGTMGGALAGAAATVPMSAFMELAHRELPFWERHSLPPRKITERVLRRAGVSRFLKEPERLAATLASHFGYGAACGAVYGATWPRERIGIASGVAFGLAVWTGSYLGWLPATGLMAPATWHSRRRNALMIGAHVVWGAALGAAARALIGRRRRDATETEAEPIDVDERAYTITSRAAYAAVL